MSSKLSRRLSSSDAAFLYFERPNAPLHVGSLGIYEGRIPFERFSCHIESRLPLIPRYRQRIVQVPFNLAHPTWEDDPDFGIDRHIFHVTLPSPGNDRQLREMAAELFARPLDRSRPLWEMYVIHGLEGDRTGIVSKVHHCMVDGVSGIELLIAVVDITPEPAPPPEAAPWEPKPLPDLAERVSEAFWDNLGQQRDALREVQEGILNPRPRIRQVLDLFRAMTTSWPWLSGPAPRTPFSVRLSGSRHVAFCDVSFVEIREIRTSLGGTVNDVVLAILAGAFRRYLAKFGQDSAELRVGIPVNVRVEDDKGTLGNRISMMLTPLPLGEPDPAERLRLVRERCDQLKQENQAGSTELLIRLTSLIPAPTQAALGALPPVNTLVNLICTNVPGPMIPLYSVGHLMLEHYPLVPLAFDLGLGVGVMSYNQRLFFGLMAEPKAVPDIDLLKQYVEESFLELRRAAGVSATDLPSFGGNGAAAGAAKAEQPV
jgi:WS/DGAT/MGAT family acyltransferase